MAMEFVARRLEIGDVVLLDLGDGAEEVEATMVSNIDRTATTVGATMRAEGRKSSSRSGLSAQSSPLCAGFSELARLQPREVGALFKAHPCGVGRDRGAVAAATCAASVSAASLPARSIVSPFTREAGLHVPSQRRSPERP